MKNDTQKPDSPRPPQGGEEPLDPAPCSATHELKTWPEYFNAVVSGEKTFEIRENDRNFKVGDQLILSEWCPEKKDFTGSSIWKFVRYITDWEQKPGFVVMAISAEPNAHVETQSSED